MANLFEEKWYGCFGISLQVILQQDRERHTKQLLFCNDNRSTILSQWGSQLSLTINIFELGWSQCSQVNSVFVKRDGKFNVRQATHFFHIFRRQVRYESDPQRVRIDANSLQEANATINIFSLISGFPLTGKGSEEPWGEGMWQD